jgi:hypothetical protein
MRSNALALLMVLVGCSSSSAGEELLGAGTGCKFVDGCGSACTSDDECGSGKYCNLANECSADCNETHGCPSGSMCDVPHGRCIVDPSALDGGTPGDGETCPNVTVTFEKRVPTVALLVDQSGSMTEKFGGGTRWTVARDSLINPTNGVVKILEKEVRFGLAMYTSKEGFKGGACPLLAEVDIALSNYAAIRDKLMASDPIGDTPTGESIDAVVKKLENPAIPGPKYIVLATDGEPDTCAVPNPSLGQPEAINAAKNSFAKGIPLFYISVGTDVSASHAQAMANAGQGLDPMGSKKAKYYVASDAASMKAAFDAIIYGVRSCTFKLNAKVVDPTKGVVTVDGVKVAYNTSDGWVLSPDGTEITLQGATCEKVKSGDHSISAQFVCGAAVR